MLSGLAVIVREPLATLQFFPWFHSSCWLPLLPCPPSASADDLSVHLVQSTAVPLNSSAKRNVQVPVGPTGEAVDASVVDVGFAVLTTAALECGMLSDAEASDGGRTTLRDT